MAPQNPYNQHDPQWVDFEIWNTGVLRFKNPRKRYIKNPGKGTRSNPHELDYLRGLHDLASLAAIQGHLTNLLGQPVRVHSIWLDKTAYVIPDTVGVSKAKRELSDLALVLHDHTNGQKVMWILQAKKANNPSGNLPADVSTKHEIELMEGSPEFTLLPRHANGPRLKFDLGQEFGGPAQAKSYKHWAFLMFRESPTYTIGNQNPMQWRWMGSGTPIVGSFMGGIVKMLQVQGQAASMGATLDYNVQGGWASLHDALLKHRPQTEHIGYADGPMHISTWAPSGQPFGTRLVVRQLMAHATHVTPQLVVLNTPTTGPFDYLSTGWKDSPVTDRGELVSRDAVFDQSLDQDIWISESIERAIQLESEENDSRGDGVPPVIRPDDPGDGDGSGGCRLTLVIEVGEPRKVVD